MRDTLRSWLYLRIKLESGDKGDAMESKTDTKHSRGVNGLLFLYLRVTLHAYFCIVQVSTNQRANVTVNYIDILIAITIQ